MEFETRKGLTRAPITTSDQHTITITNPCINVTTWLLKPLYGLNAKYLVWKVRKTMEIIFVGGKTGFLRELTMLV